METPINIELAMNPVNWITLGIWLFFIGFAMTVMGLTQIPGRAPKTGG